MSLWIRIQNKEMLINCHAIEIDLGDGKCICSNGYVLGTYSTKEKALKVIDRIEKALNKGELIELVDGRMYLNHKNTVFQMPLDIEVE